MPCSLAEVARVWPALFACSACGTWKAGWGAGLNYNSAVCVCVFCCWCMKERGGSAKFEGGSDA